MADTGFRTGEWRALAACVGCDTFVFFPPRGEDTAAARKICSTCPVTKECLEDAIWMREPAGIRGGLSTRERTKITRKRREAARKIRKESELLIRDRVG